MNRIGASVGRIALVLFAQCLGFGGYVLTSLNQTNALPAHVGLVGGLWFGAGAVTTLVVFLLAPRADPVILPIVVALTGIGLAEIHRIDLKVVTNYAAAQLVAVAIGVVCLVAVCFFLKNPARLRGFPYLLSLAGILILLLPLLPGIGRSVNGSRIWIYLPGGMSFQPAEVAKIVLAAAFAAYLADTREVLTAAGRKFLGIELPRLRDLGPIAIMWGVTVAVMVFENDLGTSLLFFGLFVMMIYTATGKSSWVILGLGMFAAAGVAAFKFVGHARTRFDYWLHPFADPDHATQILNAQFGLSHGGLFGSGWGLGRPTLNIFPASDMISASLGEEIGIVGLMGIIVLYGLLVFRGLKTALMAKDTFIKLFVAGLSFTFLLQTFAIIGGVTRLLPLTGLTTPFLSVGGSSMVANWILVGILVVISHQVRTPRSDDGIDEERIIDLEEEATQVISTKELAKLGMGKTRPVQDVDSQQVRVGPDDLPLVTAPPFAVASVSSEPDLDPFTDTVVVSPDDMPTVATPRACGAPSTQREVDPMAYPMEDLPRALRPDTTQPFNPFEDGE